MLRPFALVSLSLALPLLAGCSSDPTPEDGAGGSGNASSSPTSSSTGGAGPAAGCTEPTSVTCSDDVIQQMNLLKKPAPGVITSEPDGAGWVSRVDATAGGIVVTDSYVYARFTDTGLEKVELGDQQALESMDWDIAFRRYIIRINSGFSGPSCVRAGRVPGSATFDELTALPDNVNLRSDDIFTAAPDPMTGDTSCELIPDGSGLPESPATALSGFWKYPGCVQMTDHVFALELANGRRLKLTVTHYYSETIQEQCDTSGKVPMSNTGAGNIRLRWAFL